jgi:tetratricopeptide (TPR) repeat protein
MIAAHILIDEQPVSAYQYKWLLRDTLYQVTNKTGLDAAIKLYHTLKTGQPSAFIFDEDQLNNSGCLLLSAKKMKEAIAIFKLNTEEYPNGWNIYDSLEDAYMQNGENKLAIENYQKSVELNPDNTGGKKRLAKLGAK